MIKVDKLTAFSFSTDKKWAAEFKWGRISLEDDLREGRPITATSNKNFEKVFDLIEDNQYLKVNERAEDVGISEGYNILYMKNWVWEYKEGAAMVICLSKTNEKTNYWAMFELRKI